MKNKKFTLTTADGADMTAELDSFANYIGLEHAVSGRYSLLLLLGLFSGFKSGHLNPAKIIHEIRALEGLGASSQLKPPTQNKYQPLKGLWHKHYLQDGLSSMTKNLKKALGRYSLPSLDQSILEAEEAGEERYFTIEDIKAIADDAVHGNWIRLASDEALTGEWIIYARYEDRNYYLCLGTHDISQHENLRKQIDALCCLEFPFLPELLARA